ncbi:MAG: porin [Acidiferrobacterales bacterium]
MARKRNRTKSRLKPAVLSIAVAAGLAAAPAPSEALSLKISGQINKTIGWIDNGQFDAVGIFDNQNSGSRFRFTGSEDMGNGTSVGGVWEWQWPNSPSSAAAFNSLGEFSETSASLQDRKTELYFQARWGKLSLGKGDGAANGTAEVDLSGTPAIDYSGGNQCLLGSIQYGVAGTAPGTLTVAATYSQFDGESRNTRIRYDTPKFAGNAIAVSLGNGKSSEVAYRGAWNPGSTKFAVAAGVTDLDDAVTGTSRGRKRTAVSGSVLLGMGLNVTGSFSRQELSTAGAPKQSLTYAKVGWKKGKHAVSLSWGQSKERPVANAKATAVALGYVYKPVKFVELYGAFRTAETSAAGFSKVTAIHLGSRIKWK